MARKFKNPDLYYHRGCRVASPKEKFRKVKIGGAVFHVCPHCGSVFDLEIGNVVDVKDEAEEK